MGPYCEEKQYQRAEAIKYLLDTNPDIEPSYRAIWEKHLLNLAHNEAMYNDRVKNIYSNMMRGPVVNWDG